MMSPIIGETLRIWFLSALVVHGAVAGNPDAKRLYDDLLSNYNKLVRPVVNTSDVLRVCIKLKLSQLIDVVLPTRTHVLAWRGSSKFSRTVDWILLEFIKAHYEGLTGQGDPSILSG
ncbi:Acetylcholine receptor subunit alpha-like protein [Trachymyrmex septentrionalis]|uniref:Acetylcholine receptor subunit alpha-like protein n=1 Tax=Trachymyrmex septentrionalis TaxID=34720 RepID=A0A195ESJ4_9HYME|nr:Acetylcholine receptor subunit alpha-like protein [Trachymyrmex septentrionalis]